MLDLLQHGRHGSFGIARGCGRRIVAAHDPRHQIWILLDDFLDFAAGDPLQDHMRCPARWRDALPDLGDNADGAEFELHPLVLLIRRPATRFVTIGFGTITVQEIGKDRRELRIEQLALAAFLHHALGQNQHLAQGHAQTAVDDHRRLIILDWIRDRHMRQQDGFIDHQHRQQGRAPAGRFGSRIAHAFALGARLGSLVTRSDRLFAHCGFGWHSGDPMRLGHTVKTVVQVAWIGVQREERAVYNGDARARPIDNSSPFRLGGASMTMHRRLV